MQEIKTSFVAPQRCALPLLPLQPAAGAGRVSFLSYLRLFRRDILSAQPGHLYRAWMAELRTPFFRSFMCNDLPQPPGSTRNANRHQPMAPAPPRTDLRHPRCLRSRPLGNGRWPFGPAQYLYSVL